MSSPYNPAADISPEPISIPDGWCRRIVIIEGTNVIYSSTYNCVIGTRNKEKEYTASGLFLMVYELLRQGFEVLVTLKSHFLDDKSVENNFVFTELEKMEILTFIPEDDENSSIDDEYCLASAEYFHTAIISRDKFADHEKKYPIGVKRRIKFSFQRQKNDRDVMMQNRFDFSNVFLNDKSIESMLRDFENNVALCKPDDEEYEQVKEIYRKIGPNYFVSRIRRCEVMADYIQLRICQTYGFKLPKFDYFHTETASNDIGFPDFYEAFECFYKH